ncbi:MAG: cytochrome C oxidase subunit IV family protein [Flavobacteriales bacterium]
MERDDIIEYSLDAHHSEEEGVKIRKKIYQVTAWMTAITILEVIVGIYCSRTALMGNESTQWIWQMIKLGYIGLTLLKAGLIVMIFMHLGDERKNMKWMILAPYIAFIIYFIFICFYEAVSVGNGMY